MADRYRQSALSVGGLIGDVVAEVEKPARRRPAGRYEFGNILPYTADQIRPLLVSAYGKALEEKGVTAGVSGDALRRVESVARWLTAADTRPWLLLTGTLGSGKTTTVLAVRKALDALKEGVMRSINMNKFGTIYAEDMAVQWQWLKMERQPRVKMVTAQRLAELSMQGVVLDVYKDTTILALDDIGREPAEVRSWGTMVTPVADVLSARYDADATTIITTNLSGREMAARYGERIVDRIREMSLVVGSNVGSYRR